MANGVEADEFADVGGVDHGGGRDGDADMGDGGRAVAEEDQVARLRWLAFGDGRSGVVLVLGDSGQGDAGGGIGGFGQAGAVEAGVAVAAPGVGQAALSAGVVDGRPGDGVRRQDVVAGLGIRRVFGAGGFGDSGDDLSGGLLVLGVSVGKAGAFDGLCGVVDGHLLPTRDGEKVLVELGGGVSGVHDLGGGAPAL